MHQKQMTRDDVQNTLQTRTLALAVRTGVPVGAVALGPATGLVGAEPNAQGQLGMPAGWPGQDRGDFWGIHCKGNGS